ncbi:hypothetical protein LSAT2_013102 [Lamellibrachia satsuma]|nr:hypothetical protein LSAT2_013102 [Lamellibrachia satsuma]
MSKTNVYEESTPFSGSAPTQNRFAPRRAGQTLCGQGFLFTWPDEGCAKMKEIEAELERLRLLVVAIVGKEQMGCASGSDGGQCMIKWGKTMREMLGRAHLRLGGD